VEVCYPAELWDWNENAEGPIRNAEFVANIIAQDGTLKYIQDNLDFRMGEGELKVDGDKVTLNADVKLESQIAIWKLTLQDDAETPAALAATQVILKVDDPAATIARTTEDLSKTSTVYLALDMINEEDLTIEATVGEDTYVYTQNGVSLDRGNYYQSTVTMEKKASATPLDNTTTAWTAGTFAVPAGGLTYSDAITVSGDVTLVLTDGETLTLNKGISLAEGATLTIQGNGTMNINGTNNSTASTVAGTGMLVLTSGTLNAKGGNGDGLIITDSWLDNENNIGVSGGVAINGNVTVNGGTVTATGGNGGILDTSQIVGGYNNHGGNGGAAISGNVTVNAGGWTATNGSNGTYTPGGDDNGCSAGTGGKAVAGTVTDNR
jgi:hypothetical protein